MITRSQSGIVKPINRLSLNTFLISHIPKNPSNALKDPQWRNAMYDEYNALVKNGTWLLVPRPASVNMQHDADFNETFSSVVKPATIRTILSLVVPSLLQHLSDSLHREFDMADLRELNYFLGIYAVRHSTGLFLSQRKYALQLFERARMVNCNPSRTPVDTESELGPDGVSVQDPTLYRSLTGGLQYLTFTRPDLSYAVQQICLYMHASREPYLAALKRCPSTRSVEDEYRGVANVVAETAWLCNLLRESHSPLSTATFVYCDNVSAVYMSANPVERQRTKHIKIDIHFVQDMVTAGQFERTPPPAPTVGAFKLRLVLGFESRKRQKIPDSPPSVKPDRWRWTLVEDGEFTVKEISRLIEEKILLSDNGDRETLWNKLVPKKVNIFIWRALRGRLPVSVELDRRGIDLDLVLFPSCNDVVETCAHCLINCDLAMGVWDKILDWWKVGNVNAFTIDEFFSSNGNVNVPTYFSRVWQAVM
ncbi:ribonuclease H-like domain-containing protein [Tanacetum coccineum]